MSLYSCGVYSTAGPESSLPPFFLPFTCGHVSTRVISRGVEYKEKCGLYQEANELLELLLAQGVYNRCRRGKWWDRLALNYDFHLKEKAKVSSCNYVANSFDSYVVFLSRHFDTVLRA